MNKIEEYRVRKGLTQKELGERVGCTQVDISRYEAGTHIPSVKKLMQIARILDATLEDLL